MPEKYNYLYPNQKSYVGLPAYKSADTWQGRSLRHGYIFAYKNVAAEQNIVGPSEAATAGLRAYNRQINYQSYKMFQFNPPTLGLAATMMPVESAANEADGGNLTSPAGTGLVSTNLELFFDRTQEIARANSPDRNGNTTDEAWRDLGVQVDLFEFFKVISGGDTSQLGQFTDRHEENGTVRTGSLNHFTGAMFDSAAAGSAMLTMPFAVVFNSNLTLHVQRLTSFSFNYLRFTADLVPSLVRLDISLEILNMGTKAYATSGGIGGPSAEQGKPPDTTAINPYLSTIVATHSF